MISDYALKLIVVAIIGSSVFYAVERNKTTQHGLDKPLKIGREQPKLPDIMSPKKVKQNMKQQLIKSRHFV